MAKFEKGVLKNLAYMFWVNGAEAEVEPSIQATCDAFAEKYGKPDTGDRRHVCTWVSQSRDGQTEQTLAVTTNKTKLGERLAVFTVVVLSTAASKHM